MGHTSSAPVESCVDEKDEPKLVTLAKLDGLWFGDGLQEAGDDLLRRNSIRFGGEVED
jgi:hypothetical protein